MACIQQGYHNHIHLGGRTIITDIITVTIVTVMIAVMIAAKNAMIVLPLFKYQMFLFTSCLVATLTQNVVFKEVLFSYFYKFINGLYEKCMHVELQRAFTYIPNLLHVIINASKPKLRLSHSDIHVHVDIHKISCGYKLMVQAVSIAKE